MGEFVAMRNKHGNIQHTKSRLVVDIKSGYIFGIQMRSGVVCKISHPFLASEFLSKILVKKVSP
jgi:hypothetical protein